MAPRAYPRAASGERSRSSARRARISATTRRTRRCCLAAGLGSPPRARWRSGSASGLQGRLGSSLERFEVAGPGFLNLFLADSWLLGALADVLAAGAPFGAGRRRGARARPGRVRLGQPHRADARRPRSQCRLRRRSRPRARISRSPRGARVLRQRRRLAGAQARRVGDRAGAGRARARGRLPRRLRRAARHLAGGGLRWIPPSWAAPP